MRTSWDFWDTLCGRATGRDPWRLFDLVGGPDYRRLRQEAERQSDKTWAGIFQSLRTLSGWTKARVDELRAAEWAAEVRAAFPIAANVARVRPGDLVVTDTYFSEGQIRELADRIGLPKDLEVVATYGGKHHGTVWQRLPLADIERHVGDNLHADVRQARAAGLVAEHFRAGDETAAERWLETRGWWEAAGAARAARLQNPHPPESPAAAIWAGAASALVPFLYVAAAAVHDYAIREGYRRVLVISRDTLLLGKMLAAVYGDLEVGDFHASRETFVQPSASFVEYARRQATPGTLFVDLHGSGHSLGQFVQATGLRLPCLIVCRFHKPLAGHELVDGLCKAKSINHGTSLEVMNYHDEGRVVDVIDGRPVRQPLEYDAELVAIQQAAAAAGIAAATRPIRPPAPDELAELVARCHADAPAALRRQHVVAHPFAKPARRRLV